MTDLAGRTALVTGAAQGIGLSLACALARAGVRVALTDLDSDRLTAVTRELSGGSQVDCWALDVTDRDAFARVADQVEDRLGPVSILCSNAGVLDSVSPIKMNYAQWDWNLGINLGGVYNGIQTFVPRMIAQGGGGHIVNTSSEAGVAAGWSGFMYHASKYAVVGLSESLREELRHHAIGVSVLCPGYVNTGILDNSQNRRPSDAPAHSLRVAEVLAKGRDQLRNGISPDRLASMALTAIEQDHPYVFTSSEVGARIAARADAMLEAVPTLSSSAPQQQPPVRAGASHG